MFKTLKNFRSVTKHNSVFQEITGQHCCSQQHGEQMKVTNTTLFTKIEAEPLQSLHIHFHLAKQAKTYYNTGTSRRAASAQILMGWWIPAPGNWAAPYWPALEPGRNRSSLRTCRALAPCRGVPWCVEHRAFGRKLTATVSTVFSSCVGSKSDLRVVSGHTLKYSGDRSAAFLLTLYNQMSHLHYRCQIETNRNEV